jgi:hypothetical protein
MRFPNFVELATVVMGRLEDGCGYRDFRPRCVCIRTFLKRAKDAAPKYGRSVIYLIRGGVSLGRYVFEALHREPGTPMLGLFASAHDYRNQSRGALDKARGGAGLVQQRRFP